jgi:putative transposase
MNDGEAKPPNDGARRSPSTAMPEGRVYPARLYHEVPAWVRPGRVFHVRVRCAPGNGQSLIVPTAGAALIEAAKFYHERQRWWVSVFLLMPDHWHALLSFPREEKMNRVIGDWKRFQEKQHGIAWQEGFFDHRIRSDEEFQLKAGYFRKNPVVKELCARSEDWPWVWPKAVDGDLRAPSD